MNEARMYARTEILESCNYCPSGYTSQLCGGSISWQRRASSSGNCQLTYFFCLMLGILLDISGHAHLVKEMTTSSTAILLTKRYPNPNDCKSGTKRCWTNLCQSVLSMITRFVECMCLYWGGNDQSCLCFFLALCLVLRVYYIKVN